MSFIKKNITFLLLSLCVFSQLHYFNSVPRLNSDHLDQLTYTQNWIKGNGHSVERADPNDYSLSNYEHNGNWPPGFSVLCIPLLKLSIGPLQILNLLASVGIVICILGLYWVFSILSEEYKSQSGKYFFIAFLAFSNSLFRTGGATDFLSLGFFLIALGFFLFRFKSQVNNNKELVVNIFLLSVFTSLTFWFRYAYLLVSFSFVLLFFLRAMKNKTAWKYMVLHFIFHILLISPIFFWMTYFELDDAPSVIVEKLHFSGLMDLDSFGFNSFFIYSLFEKVTIALTNSYVALYFVGAGISLLILSLILFLLAKLVKNDKSYNLLILILPMLIYVYTLAHRFIQLPFAGFENRYHLHRYYILCYSIVILLGVVLAFSNIKYVKLKFKIMLKYLLFFSLFINISYWTYYKVKFKFFDYKYNLSQFYAPEGATNDYFLLSNSLKNYESPNKKVFVLNRGVKNKRLKGKDNFMFRFASLSGCSMLLKENIKIKKPYSNNAIDLFVPLPTDTNDVFLEKFCEEYKAKLYKNLNSAKFNIMLVKLSPHSLKND